MDFFEHQERAKRNTLVLSFVFIVAVILIIAAVYAVLAYLFLGERPPPAEATDWFSTVKRLWDPYFFMWTAIGTLAVISTGTLYKMKMLSAGGEAVARMFGATRIDPMTSVPAERRLLNVVEEIAIASGVSGVTVYVLDEDSINAFAAGFSTKDAIIGVTRGCMNLLSRDELQAVIAHEFSHILNGDMRLNIRLMGVLHGILLISLIGWWILRTSSFSSRSSSSTRKKGGSTIVMLLAGLAIMIIGFVGVFFARVIKSAVSRQREFLADAASVQFTRNPDGMTGALKKIGGFVPQGRINNPNAEDASHLFFADGLKRSFFNMMSTHPPLAERIRRIDSSFDGAFPETIATASFSPDKETALKSNLHETTKRMADNRQTDERSIPLDPNRAIKTIGRMDADSLNNTGHWLAALPPAIRVAVRDPSTAQALIMVMLISNDKDIRGKQLLYLKDNLNDTVYSSIQTLIPLAKNCARDSFLPLVELASSSLRNLRASDLKTFAGHLRHLVESDGTITLFEYMTQALIAAHIKNWTEHKNETLFQSSNLKHFLPSIYIVISTLAYYGTDNENEAKSAFSAAVKRLKVSVEPLISSKEQCGLQQTDQALSTLTKTSPAIKKIFLDACCVCVAHNGKTNVNEAELLRTIAAILDCPVPPFLPANLH